jgi:hypothetical protein
MSGDLYRSDEWTLLPGLKPQARESHEDRSIVALSAEKVKGFNAETQRGREKRFHRKGAKDAKQRRR